MLPQIKVKVKRSLDDEMSLTNCIYVHPTNYMSLFGIIDSVGSPALNCVVLENEFHFCYAVIAHEKVEVGFVLMNSNQRSDNHLAFHDEVILVACKKEKELSLCINITFQVALVKATKTIQKVDYKDIVNGFRRLWWQPFSTKQHCHIIIVGDIRMMCEVKQIHTINSSTGIEIVKDGQHAFLSAQTILSFEVGRGELLRIMNNRDSKQTTDIIKRDWSFEQMGIGGLDRQFATIFRRAFASRVYPPSFIKKMGIRHVKGILLFGPPGTGKTLMARQIARMLNAKEPKIVNGPEILNKFVGQSEENIRALFKEAEREQEERGDESELHVIIFDEIDAICAQRGSHGTGGTGVADTVVNQLLSKMDGVQQLNNMLIIGMTNRLDMIDEALLRPGRFEMHVEVGLPDEEGRLQILKIHTARMQENKILSEDVDLSSLARITRNFTGAEIEGLIRSASAFAMDRHINIHHLKEVSKELESTIVCAADFTSALKECKAAYGVSDNDFNQQHFPNGIIRFSEKVQSIINGLSSSIQQVLTSSRTTMQCILLQGKNGSGKTAMACHMALQSNIPFVRMLSAETLLGYNEASKCARIRKTFDEADRSATSFIVIDDIERILEYVAIGPRFSNAILQTLAVLLRKTPAPEHRLFLLCTTSDSLLMRELGLMECFDDILFLPTIDSSEEMNQLIQNLEPSLSMIESTVLFQSLSVKKAIARLERKKQDPTVEWSELLC